MSVHLYSSQHYSQCEDREITELSPDKSTDKEMMACAHRGILRGLKKEESPACRTHGWPWRTLRQEM